MSYPDALDLSATDLVNMLEDARDEAFRLRLQISGLEAEHRAAEDKWAKALERCQRDLDVARADLVKAIGERDEARAGAAVAVQEARAADAAQADCDTLPAVLAHTPENVAAVAQVIADSEGHEPHLWLDEAGAILAALRARAGI